MITRFLCGGKGGHSKEAHAKPKPNKSSTHRKEADSKQSPGIKAVSPRDPNYTKIRRLIPSSHCRKERKSTHHSRKDQVAKPIGRYTKTFVL
jgi:hypothetical protein